MSGILVAPWVFLWGWGHIILFSAGTPSLLGRRSGCAREPHFSDHDRPLLYQASTAARAAGSARQPFLKKQMELCIQASEHAGRMATATKTPQWQKAWEEFWMLYYGPMVVVESEGPRPEIYSNDVARTMVEFGGAIRKDGRGPDHPSKLPTMSYSDPRSTSHMRVSALSSRGGTWGSLGGYILTRRRHFEVVALSDSEDI
jgi:hypothetical protein